MFNREKKVRGSRVNYAFAKGITYFAGGVTSFGESGTFDELTDMFIMLSKNTTQSIDKIKYDKIKQFVDHAFVVPTAKHF